MGRILGRGYPVQPKYGSTDHTTRFSDNFNRADGDVGAQYDTVTGFSPMYVVSNQAYGLDNVAGRSLSTVKASVAAFSADHEATATLATVTDFDFMWLVVRANAASANFYSIAVDGLNRRIQRWTSGVATQIGSKDIVVVSGDVVTLRALGTTISVWVNGVLRDAVSDATHTTGQPGFGYDYQNNRSSRIDNFTAADVVGLTTVVHQIASSGGDYTSLSAWEAAQQRDLVAAKAVAIAECQAFVDTTAFTIDGWTTDATRYIEVRATTAAAAKLPFSVAGTSAYVLRSTAAAVLTVNESYTKIRRLQVQTQSTSGSSAIRTTSGVVSTGVLIDSCVVAGIKHADVNQIHYGVEHLSGSVMYVVNCVALNMTTANTNSSGFRSNTTGGTMHVYNCTSIGSGAGSGFKRDDGSIIVKNSLAGGVLTTGFSGFFNASSTNNATMDSSAPGSNPRTLQTFTFADPRAEDYRLSWEDAGARGFGANLSADATYAFSTDFNGRTRTIWDIGATNAPVGVVSSVAASGGDYTSLNAWEAAQQRNLVTDYQVAVAVCSAFQDTTQVTVDGWTTDSACHVIVRPASGAEARLPWSTASYRLVVAVGAGSNALSLVEQYTRIERIQVQVTTTGQDTTFGYTGIQIGSGTTAIGSIIDGCFIRANTSSWVAGSTGVNAINAGPDINGNLYIRNTVIADFTYATVTNGTGIRTVNHTSGKTYVHNCTIVNTGRCVWDGYSDTVARNTLVVPATGGAGFHLSFDAATNYNASSDASAVGANSRVSQTFTFADYAGGDYRLAATDTGARGFGTDLSANSNLAVTRDFSGYTRVGAWDIGASEAPTAVIHQIAASGGDYTSLSAWEAAQQRNVVTAHEAAIAECQAFADTTAVTIDGWTSDAQHCIEVRAAAGAVAQMPWSESAYRLSVDTTNSAFTTNESSVKIKNIQIENISTNPTTGNNSCVAISNTAPPGVVEFTGLLVRKRNGFRAGMNANANIYATCSPGVTTITTNCVSIGNQTGYIAQSTEGAGITHIAYNNTVIEANGAGYFITGYGTSDAMYFKNNLGFNNGTDFYRESTWSTEVFSNNASEDATGFANTVGGGTLRNRTFTFVNAAGGDYHLTRADVGAQRVGVSLAGDAYFPVTTDFDQATRRAVNWDIGADQLVDSVIAESTGYALTGTDASLTFTGGGGGDTRSINHTAGATADLTLGAVFVVATDVSPAVTATYDGNAMTAVNDVDDAGNDYHLALFSKQPTTAAESAFEATSSAGLIKAMAAVSFDQVPVSAGVRSSQTQTGTDDSPTITMTDVSTLDKVVAFVSWYGTSAIVVDEDNGEVLLGHAEAGNHHLAVISKPGSATTVTFNPILSASSPWQIVAASVKSALAGAFTITAEAGSVVLTGQDASLEHGREVPAETGAVTLTGQDASLEVGREVAADPGAVVVTGQDANLEFGREVAADSGAVTLAGQVANLNFGFRLAAEAGAVVLTGADATLGNNPTIGAEAGAIAINGTDASLERSWFVLADAGAVALSGTDANLEVGREVAADAGSVAITGTDAALEVGHRLVADSAAVAISGTAANTEFGRKVAADAGTLAINGTDASLEVGREVSAESGTVALTGQDAALEFGREVAADAGSIVLTGTLADVRYTRRMVAEAGSVVITGSEAILSTEATLNAEGGTLALAGQQANLEYNRRMVADATTLALTGQEASLEHGREVAADSGAIAVAGTDARLATSRRTLADAGAVAVTGQDAALRRALRVSAESGTVAITGSDVGLGSNPILGAEAGAVVLTGTVANTRYGRRMVAETGAVVVTGSAANMARSRLFSAEAASFTLTPQDANLEFGRETQADTGAFSLGGQDASLRRTVRLVADPAAFSLAAPETGLRRAARVAADTAAFTLTPQDSGLRATRRVVGEAGTAAVTGTVAQLLQGHKVASDPGTVTITGEDAYVGPVLVFNSPADAFFMFF